jgi:hypothetical protein
MGSEKKQEKPPATYESVQVRDAGKQGDRTLWQVFLVATSGGRVVVERPLCAPTHRFRADELARIEFSRRVLA